MPILFIFKAALYVAMHFYRLFLKTVRLCLFLAVERPVMICMMHFIYYLFIYLFLLQCQEDLEQLQDPQRIPGEAVQRDKAFPSGTRLHSVSLPIHLPG